MQIRVSNPPHSAGEHHDVAHSCSKRAHGDLNPSRCDDKCVLVTHECADGTEEEVEDGDHGDSA